MGKLHPQIQNTLDEIAQILNEMGLTDFHSGGVEPARALLRALAAPVEVLPQIHKVKNIIIPGPGGEIPLRVYYPSSGTNFPVLVWFHGGGWVLGDFDTAEYNCRSLANDVGCVVVSVDYRLAPETAFPGAIDDCFCATTWVHKHAGELGIDATKIAVGGDSAGGNLAACVALRAGHKHLPIVFQFLLYPVIDADFDRSSYKDYAQDYLLTRDAMEWYWDCYVPDKDLRKNPAVSPLHAQELGGLPPALIMTAECDPLRDEGEVYGDALAAAGVDVKVKQYKGMIHGFFNLLTEVPINEVIEASLDAVKALQKTFRDK